MSRIQHSLLRCSAQSMRKRGVRRGVAAVEFAIIAPLFFMLILATVEIGRAMMVQQILVNASRVGARRATTLTSSQQAVTDAVAEYAAGVGISGVEVSVSPNPATAAAGAAITVDVEIDYSKVSWLPAPWFMGGKQLVASSVMRKEGF
jgi:Flp pilus assembly protein TadG